eukprot:g1536.t1
MVQSEKKKIDVEQLSIEMESRCDVMRLHALKLADSLRNALRVELIKIPPSIRQMSYEKVCSSHDTDLAMSSREDDDIQKVLRDLSLCGEENNERSKKGKKTKRKGKGREKRKDRAGRPPLGTKTRQTKKARTFPPRSTRITRTMKKAMASKSHTIGSYNGDVAATPSRRTRSSASSNENTEPNVPYTPATRAARYGEVLLSANGSPLGTVSKTKLKIGRKQASTSIQLELQSGAVNLNEAAAVKSLSAGQKEEAMQQILDAQSHLASLLAQLQ